MKSPMLKSFEDALEKAKKSLAEWSELTVDDLLDVARDEAEMWGTTPEQEAQEMIEKGIKRATNDIRFYENEIKVYHEDFDD